MQLHKQRLLATMHQTRIGGALFVFLLLCCAILTPSAHAQCNDLQVVRCFTDLLETWAWNLWSIRLSIEAFNKTTCENHDKLRKCVDFEGCSRQQTIEISRVVTDLMQHSKESGTFLQSFFAVEFACTEEGRRILHQNKDCLQSYRLGHEVVEAVNKIGRSLEDQPSSEYCRILRDEVRHVDDDLKLNCHGNRRPLKLICRAIVDPFKHLRNSELADCDPCQESSDEEQEGEDGEGEAASEEGEETKEASDYETQPVPSEAQNHKQDATKACSSIFGHRSFFPLLFVSVFTFCLCLCNVYVL